MASFDPKKSLSAAWRRLSGGGRDRFAVRPDAKRRSDLLYYELDGQTRKAHRSWYRGAHTNFHPTRKALEAPDALARHVGHGWFPAEPFIDKSTYITAFGSCFAAEVTKYLYEEGYSVFGRDMGLNSHVVRSGEGIVNTDALRRQFEWAYGDYQPGEGLWFDKSGRALDHGEEVREATREIFERTDVFILTLGLSEAWYDKQSGEVFWRGVPSDQFDPERHGFKVLGTEENRENLERIYDLIRENRPDAVIVVTLSPVPLAATFRPVSCITANAVSKASLRVAIDELMRAHEEDERLFYFPSYEIVTDVIPDAMEDDMRHPRKPVIRRIMKTFHAAYLT